MYELNSPRVVHETLDGETIIIDTLSGLYYTVSGQASLVWSALVGGQLPAQIAPAFSEALSQNAIETFLHELLTAELLRPGTGAMGLPVVQPATSDEPILRLQRHADLQELIELDPIHEVDVTQGWPVQPPEPDR